MVFISEGPLVIISFPLVCIRAILNYRANYIMFFLINNFQLLNERKFLIIHTPARGSSLKQNFLFFYGFLNIIKSG